MRKKQDDVGIDIMKLSYESFRIRIVGDSPMIYNTMSEKARHDLLLPPSIKEKSRRKKAGVLKHEPVAEYRGSVYRFRGDDGPTRLLFPAGGAKAAIAQAAIDIPGAAKAQVGRLCHIMETNIPVWGVPQLLMSVVRSAGMNRTPDIRTRAILPEWCAEFRVRYTVPNLTEADVGNLIAAAGIIIGWGDWRPEKGKGNFGQYSMVDEDDERFGRIVGSGGREAQDEALLNPTCFDVESEELLEWFSAETKRRSLKVAS